MMKRALFAASCFKSDPSWVLATAAGMVMGMVVGKVAAKEYRAGKAVTLRDYFKRRLASARSR